MDKILNSLNNDIKIVRERSSGLAALLRYVHNTSNEGDERNLNLSGALSSLSLLAGDLDEMIETFEQQLDSYKSQMEAIK